MSVMSKSPRHPGLLPDGFRDVMAPDAWAAEQVRRDIIDWCIACGYDLVSPPLMEFQPASDSFASGDASFYVMDPDSQQIMRLRSDMTPQMARLAGTRLEGQTRPVRLCYAGDVLRAKGSQLRPIRQFTQAGAELIGPPSLGAEVEIIVLGAMCLKRAGLTGLSIDLTIPTLPSSLMKTMGIDEDRTAAMLAALDQRDTGALAELDPEDISHFQALISATGLADDGLAALDALKLSGDAGRLTARLRRLVEAVQLQLPDIPLTIDPCERRGFDYKSGIAFSYFRAGEPGELGRGGRYNLTLSGGNTEQATGFSLYLDRVQVTDNPAKGSDRVYAPYGIPAARLSALREQGYQVIGGLEDDEDDTACTLGCQWVADVSGLIPLDTK